MRVDQKAQSYGLQKYMACFEKFSVAAMLAVLRHGGRYPRNRLDHAKDVGLEFISKEKTMEVFKKWTYSNCFWMTDLMLGEWTRKL